MKRFLVSTIQFDVTTDAYSNFQTVEKLFAVAGGRKSRFIVLPEMFVAALKPDQLEEFSHHSVEILRFLQAAAKKYGFYIIGGSMPVKSQRENKFYNRSYLISNEGGVMGFYDKAHLFFENEEDIDYSPGLKPPVVYQTFLAPIGVQICFDIRFPEPIRLLVKEGMKILFVPAQFPNPRKEHWLTLLKARAIENQIYIVAANRIGKTENTSFFGHSLIIDPYGEVLANGYEKEGVVSEYVDLDFLEKTRKNFPVLKWLLE